MQSIQMLLKAPGLSVIKQSITYTEFPVIEYFYLCREAPLRLREQATYIGSSAQLQPLLAQVNGTFPVLFIVTDDNEELWEVLQNHPCNLLFIPQDPMDIFNQLNDLLGSYRKWNYTFELLSLQKASLQSIIEAGADMLACPLFLVNSGFSLVAGQVTEQVSLPWIVELQTLGFLSNDSLHELQEDPDQLLQPIRQGTNILAYILASGLKDEYAISFFLPLLQKIIKEYYPVPAPETALYYDVEFEQLISDLLDMNVSSADQVIERFSKLHINVKTIFLCMVIQSIPDQEINPITPMLPKLQKMMPEGHFCVYQKGIVGFLPIKNHEFPDLRSVAFHKLLNDWRVLAGCSSRAARPEQFRTFYLMAEQAIRFGRVLGHDDGNNIPVYFYEEFRTYHIIDMCREGFTKFYQHDNLIYLCHPFIIRIYQYDLIHHSDYLKILNTYLRLNCNLAQTARELNYHRNTMMNKIDKIESILGTSLDKPQLNQALIFSHSILRYIFEYLNEDIFTYRIAKKYSSDDLLS